MSHRSQKAVFQLTSHEPYKDSRVDIFIRGSLIKCHKNADCYREIVLFFNNVIETSNPIDTKVQIYSSYYHIPHTNTNTVTTIYLDTCLAGTDIQINDLFSKHVVAIYKHTAADVFVVARYVKNIDSKSVWQIYNCEPNCTNHVITVNLAQN
jgi:hypothetical protein